MTTADQDQADHHGATRIEPVVMQAEAILVEARIRGLAKTVEKNVHGPVIAAAYRDAGFDPDDPATRLCLAMVALEQYGFPASAETWRYLLNIAMPFPWGTGA